MVKYLRILAVVFFTLLTTALANAAINVPMHLLTAKGEGKDIGSVTLSQSKYGLMIQPRLHDLPPGLHGFHVHVKPDCADMGQAAGGHYDPDKTNKHLGPYNNAGHRGDLPALYVDQNGDANLPELAPRLSLKEVKGHALMIHEGGDNYSDDPPMGGGGARIACGVVR